MYGGCERPLAVRGRREGESLQVGSLADREGS